MKKELLTTAVVTIVLAVITIQLVPMAIIWTGLSVTVWFLVFFLFRYMNNYPIEQWPEKYKKKAKKVVLSGGTVLSIFSLIAAIFFWRMDSIM